MNRSAPPGLFPRQRRARRPRGAALLLTPALLASPALLGGCALTSKAEPLSVGYLHPARVPAGAPGAALPLELERTSAGPALSGILLVAVSEHLAVEVEGWRWADDPARSLERALGRTLFEAEGGPGAFRRALSGAGVPRLELRLESFELDAGGQAKVALSATLWRDEQAVLERSYLGRGPVGSEARAAALAGEALGPEAGERLARGFGAALGEVAGALRADLLAALR